MKASQADEYSLRFEEKKQVVIDKLNDFIKTNCAASNKKYTDPKYVKKSDSTRIQYTFTPKEQIGFSIYLYALVEETDSHVRVTFSNHKMNPFTVIMISAFVVYLLTRADLIYIIIGLAVVASMIFGIILGSTRYPKIRAYIKQILMPAIIKKFNTE